MEDYTPQDQENSIKSGEQHIHDQIGDVLLNSSDQARIRASMSEQGRTGGEIGGEEVRAISCDAIFATSAGF